MSPRTQQIGVALDDARRNRRDAWQTYHTARRDHLPLAHMNEIATGVEHWHSEVQRLTRDLDRSQRQDAIAAADVERLRAESEATR